MVKILGDIKSAAQQGVAYLQHGMCAVVERCGSTMQVGAMALCAIEVSDYAKEQKLWMPSDSVKNVFSWKNELSSYCNIDPKVIAVSLFTVGSIFRWAGQHVRMDVDKIKELNAALVEYNAAMVKSTNLINGNAEAIKASNIQKGHAIKFTTSHNKSLVENIRLGAEELRLLREKSKLQED